MPKEKKESSSVKARGRLVSPSLAISETHFSFGVGGQVLETKKKKRGKNKENIFLRDP